jgi:hypothetical protein
MRASPRHEKKQTRQHRAGLLVILLAGLAGCHKRPATHDDCLAVIDRLVELELTESGFHDPVVTRRWTEELRRQLAPHLARCEGRRVPENLRACLTTAHFPEEIEHRCLR